ncbi:MAG: adenylate/guanylate cyclase domain-containing protein [Actinomycetota bacterium]
MQPDTLFARGPEGQIAYQVFGDGPDLLFLPPWLWSIELMWDEPRIERFLNRLATFSRVIMCDKRGMGSSDSVPLGALPTLEEWTDDIGVVLDAAGSERPAIVANADGAPMALIYAAAHPERTTSITVIDGYACTMRHDDYPPGLPPRLRQAAIETVTRDIHGWANAYAPSLIDDHAFVRWFGRFMRLAASPAFLERMYPSGFDWDVRAALPAIRVPTLVIHHSENRYFRAAHGRYLAEHIADARLVELPGRDSSFYAQDHDPVLNEIQGFVTGVRGEVDLDRVLATVMFTDLVSSTEHAAALGDRRWREVLDAHDRLTARYVDHFRGRLVKTTGDGVLATFDGPARAIRCALAVSDEMSRVNGVDVRSGLHTGEVELRGEDVGGMGVHIAARVMGEAGPSEVIVSSTVKDLVVGSGIEFDDRGRYALKGVPGEWRLFAVKS